MARFWRLGKLRSRNVFVRRQAAERLGKSGRASAGVVRGLSKALADPDIQVRAAAARSLGALNAVPETEAERTMVLLACGREAEGRGEPAVAAALDWLARLEDQGGRLDVKTHEVAVRIGEWLKEARSPAAVELMARSLAAGREFMFRKRVCDALAAVGDGRAIGILLSLPRNETLDFAFEYLSEFLPRESALGRLIESFRNQARSAEARAVIARTMGKIGGPAAVEALLDGLSDKAKEVRIASASALGRLKAQAAADRLDGMLEDEYAGASAAAALAAIGDDRAFERLEAALRGTNSRRAMSAGTALAEAGTEAALSRLLADLECDSPEVRLRVVEALKGAAGPRAGEALSRALRDASAKVRKGAAYSLRKIGGRRTVEALIDALASADDELTRVLIECLGGIGDPIALDPIRTVLSRAEGETRHIALRASGMLGDKAAARELVDLIFTGAPGDPKALYYASCREHGHSGPLPDDLRALEKSAGAEAIRPLIGLAEDSGYGAMIVQVVSKILERDAAAVDDELLVELARLQAVSWVHDSHFGTRTRFDGRRIIQEHFVGGGGARKVPADCSAVHVLAQKEIQRRIQGRTVMRKPAPD